MTDLSKTSGYSMADDSRQRDLMSQLPYEILEMISGYLEEKEDAASVRLVSRMFSQLVEPTRQLFRLIGVHLTSRSAHRLEGISRYQHIRRRVERLLFFLPLGEVPQSALDLVAFRESTWMPFYCNSLGELLDEDNISESYRRAYDEQQPLLGDTEIMIRFSLAISALPNLTHVTLEDEWPVRCIEHSDEVSTCWQSEASKGYLERLLWTVICMDARIRKLELPLCGPGDMSQVLAAKESVHLDRFLDGIEELRLEMQEVYVETTLLRRSWRDRAYSLSRLLQRARCLTCLEIRQLVQIKPALRTLLDPVTLPRLQSLDLELLDLHFLDIRVHEYLDTHASQSLASFLERHASTLEIVRLAHFSFSRRRWREILRVLRWKCNLKNCWISLHSTKDQVSLDMGSYVLGEPWTETLSQSLGPEPVEER